MGKGWEYRYEVRPGGGQFPDHLVDETGAAGWEAVGMGLEQVSGEVFVHILFKRPLDWASSADQ